MTATHLIEQIVRRERGRLIASLVARLGATNVDLVEDVAQDAIVSALSSWPYKGVPDHPAAWLRKVAYNRAIDRLRRSVKHDVFEEDNLPTPSTSDHVISPTLGDPELDLMILCCDPALSPMDQLALTLKTVSGFTARDTAHVFLIPENTLAQRLARAKRTLRKNAGQLGSAPTRFEVHTRQPILLKTIYLMFASGYAPQHGDRLIQHDICVEALRLCEALTANKLTNTPETQALMALLLFQLSRFKARLNQSGKLVLLEDQDRNLWDEDCIQRAVEHLQHAKEAKTLSRYHIEAAIASCHALAPDWNGTDWRSIISLYQALSDLAPSPIILVNMAVAYAMDGQLDKASALLDQLETEKTLKTHAPFALAKAKVAELNGDLESAKRHYKAATTITTSQATSDFINDRLSALESL